ncbi:MAG: TonB-dependent receptor [Bacteroidaceae bacterium]|nr:TonB-dependent receptor [Bacteroidaceae bacterium]
MRKRLLPLGAAFLMLGGYASAQDQDSLFMDIEEVQVISTRANSKTPVAYSHMEKEQIEEVNHGKDIPTILNMLPSVTTSSDAGTGIGYTGIHVRGTDPTRINVTANGIPLNDAESSQLYWVNLGDFASSVQSMQLQRGVGTSTNGAGAFGATLNLKTDNLSAEPYVGVDLSGGSYGTHKETVRFSTGLFGKHWGIQGRLSNIGSDGYIDRASTKLNSYFLQAGYMDDNTVVKFVTFNGWEKTYHAWDYASKQDMKTYGRKFNPSGMYFDQNGDTAFYKNQTDNYHQQHYQLHWNQYLTNFWSLNAALHYTHGDGYYEQYKEGQKLYKYMFSQLPGSETFQMSKANLVRQKRMRNDFYGAVASLNFDNRSGLSANIGGGWNRYDGDHFGKLVNIVGYDGVIPRGFRYYDNDAKKTDFNVYGKLNYELFRNFNAFVDLQYRHVGLKMDGTSQEYDDLDKQVPFDLNRKYDFFNPKFGITYSPAKGHTAYASYAIAHKEPTRNDFEDMMSETDQVDPKAERLNDLELGYRFQARKFTASANFFFMDYDNQFVLTGAQDSNGEMVARNIKDSYRMGVELAATWQPLKGFTWDANATWSKNRAKNMNVTVINEDWSQSYANVGTTHLAYSPDFILNNKFSYEWKGLKASLFTKYISEQYMTNSGFKGYLEEDGSTTSAMIDKIFTTDLDVNYSFKFGCVKRLTVGATVYNLFNEKYESNGSCSMNFRNNNGKIEAYNGGWAWATFSAQAPTHFMAYLSINF